MLCGSRLCSSFPYREVASCRRKRIELTQPLKRTLWCSYIQLSSSSTRTPSASGRKRFHCRSGSCSRAGGVINLSRISFLCVDGALEPACTLYMIHPTPHLRTPTPWPDRTISGRRHIFVDIYVRLALHDTVLQTCGDQNGEASAIIASSWVHHRDRNIFGHVATGLLCVSIHSLDAGVFPTSTSVSRFSNSASLGDVRVCAIHILWLIYAVYQV